MLYRSILAALGAALLLAVPALAQHETLRRGLVEIRDAAIQQPSKWRRRAHLRGAASRYAHARVMETSPGNFMVEVTDEPWHAPTARRTLNLARPIVDLQVGDVNGDGLADLVVMAQGSPWGSILVYLDILNSTATQPTSVIGALGSGSATYAGGTLKLIWDGTKDLLVIGDSGYDGAAGNDLGLLLVIDHTGQLRWGFQGAFPGARLAYALAAWDGSSPTQAQVAATTPGWQGPGRAGRVDVFWLSTGQSRIAVQGAAGAEVGDGAEFLSDDHLVVASSSADDVNAGEVDNGYVMTIDLQAQTAPATFGQQGEKLGTNLARWDSDPMGTHQFLVTSRKQMQVRSWSSTSPVAQWLPLSPTAEFLPGEGLHLLRGINTAGYWAGYTTMETNAGATDYRTGWLQQGAPFAADLMRLSLTTPNVVNFLLDGPPGGLAVTAFAWGGLGNNLAIPGIQGIVPLRGPITTFGFVTLDGTGFGLQTLVWPGAPGFPPAELSFLAAIIGPGGAVVLVNPIVLNLEA